MIKNENKIQLLFQSDDFGISEGVTLGIVKGIKEGLIRNTGLFVNMNSSEFAAEFIPQFPECAFGLDVNVVTGMPISDPLKVPSLIDENGYFIRSQVRFNDKSDNDTKERSSVELPSDPFEYDELLIEMEAQYNRFIELVGHKPDYIHPHSVISPKIIKAFRAIANKYDLKFSIDFSEKNGFYSLPTDWNIKPLFKVEDQLKTNVEKLVIEELSKSLEHKRIGLICHAGFVDDDLLNVSSYSLIRARDLHMATSDSLKKFIKDNNIELVTYKDFN